MTHASACTTLSPEAALRAQVIADVWRLRGFTDEADNLLAILGMPLPRPSQPLPAGVADFAAYRRRRQAVTR